MKKIQNKRVSKQQRYAIVFAALGDETRLGLIGKLTRGKPRSISELTEGTTISRQAVTKHLRVLQNAGLVERVRESRESLFELNPKPIAGLTEYLSLISAEWDNALSRLKTFVED